MHVRFDHAVVVVSSLSEASRQLGAAGFTVIQGGRHDAIPTENALVCFPDGSYLELLAAQDPATRHELRELRASGGWERHLRGVSAVARRFLPLLAGPDGVADWVLGTGALRGRAARLRALGLEASGPLRMSRERPDGERLEWELLLPASPLHPFWVSDRTPRERRVPTDPVATLHANGARGVAGVRVRAPIVPTAALELGDMLNVRPAVSADGTSVLELGALRVEVVPGDPAGAAAIMLAGCGPLTAEVTALGVLREVPR